MPAAERPGEASHYGSVVVDYAVRIPEALRFVSSACDNCAGSTARWKARSSMERVRLADVSAQSTNRSVMPTMAVAFCTVQRLRRRQWESNGAASGYASAEMWLSMMSGHLSRKSMIDRDCVACGVDGSCVGELDNWIPAKYHVGLRERRRQAAKLTRILYVADHAGGRYVLLI